MRHIDDKAIIEEIIQQSTRIKFLLIDRYKISPDEITAVIIDRENQTVDFRTETSNLRFEMKDGQNLLLPSAKDVRNLELALDPWCWQNIMEIIYD